jgi:hypothetical protein
MRFSVSPTFASVSSAGQSIPLAGVSREAANTREKFGKRPSVDPIETLRQVCVDKKCPPQRL